jgi:hypothetical protein
LFSTVVARYARKAGISGKTQGLRKEPNPAMNAIKKLSEAVELTPETLIHCRNEVAKAKFAILLNWFVNTKTPKTSKITPKI